MADEPVPFPFPLGGLDVSRGREHQKLGTAAEGVNVRSCDPSTMRLRGGSRPGTIKYIPGQIPEGSEAFQELNFVVIASADALPTGIEDPGQDTFVDDSSVGPSLSWGTGDLFTDPNDTEPTTGADQGTRIPLNVLGQPPRRRKRGSGFQPNKNKIDSGASGSGTAYCTNVRADYKYHVGAPNTGNFDGTTTTFSGLVCKLWTTVDAGTFPAEVAAQKLAIAAKADQYAVIVNQREAARVFVLGLGNPTCTMEFLGATVDTPNPLNTCDPRVANACNDPNY